MPDDSVLRSIERLCDLPPASLRPDTSLATVEKWDSLRVVEFVAMVDSDYGITLDFEKMTGCTTAGDLASLVEDSRNN